MNAGGTTGNGFSGAGASVTAATFINAASGVVTGGVGVSGGGASSGGGSGGGAGVTLNNGVIENYGLINGGDTGFTNNSVAGVGLGVDAISSTIINAGTISSGHRSGGGFTTAINFANGGNTLELRQGFVINGNVLAGVYRQAGPGRRDERDLQRGADRACGAVWRLRALRESRRRHMDAHRHDSDGYAVEADWRRLADIQRRQPGAAAGGITFDGGTLNTTATFTSDRDITLTGAGTIDVGNLRAPS